MPLGLHDLWRVRNIWLDFLSCEWDRREHLKVVPQKCAGWRGSHLGLRDKGRQRKVRKNPFHPGSSSAQAAGHSNVQCPETSHQKSSRTHNTDSTSRSLSLQLWNVRGRSNWGGGTLPIWQVVPWQSHVFAHREPAEREFTEVPWWILCTEIFFHFNFASTHNIWIHAFYQTRRRGKDWGQNNPYLCK